MTRKYLLKNLAFLLLITLLLPLVGCQDKEQPVRIGVIADDFLDDAYHSLNGIELALADVEQEGGLMIDGRKVKLELVVEKIEFNPEQAVAAIRKLINKDDVVAVIGPQYSGDAIPTASIAEISRVPMISPMSTNSKTTYGRSYVFRMSYLDGVQGRVMAQLAADDLKAERAAILYNKADPYSVGLSEVFFAAFAKRGEVVATETYLTGDTDFSEQFGRIEQADPDVLYIPGFLEDIAGAVRQFKEKELDVQLLGSDGWNQVDAPKTEGFEKTFYTSHWSPLLPYAETKRFNDRYFERYQREPVSTAALSYDALRLVVEAMRQSNDTDSKSVRDGLVELPSYRGVGGVIDFESGGDPKKSVLVLQVVAGRNEVYRVVEPGVID